MKKYNLFKMASLAFLGSFVLTMYSTKAKSIMFGADLPTYLVFACTTILCGILLLSTEDIKDWIQMISKKNDFKKDIPEVVYQFCKKYYFESEAKTTEFVKNEVNNKDVANFFVRYLDKNTKEEIDEYLASQDILKQKKQDNARKVVRYNNLFILLGVVASYIYDSNLKGVLLLAGALSIYNLILAENIEKNIVTLKQLNLLYKGIAEDILHFKNAKFIMYKCRSILMLEDEYMSIDNITIPSNEEVNNNIKEDVKKAKPELKDLNIESRKSMLITIGKNKNINKDKNSKVVNS